MDTTRDLLKSEENVALVMEATEAAVDFLSIASAFVISRNETTSIGNDGNISGLAVVTNVSSVRHLNPSVQV